MLLADQSGSRWRIGYQDWWQSNPCAETREPFIGWLESGLMRRSLEQKAFSNTPPVCFSEGRTMWLSVRRTRVLQRVRLLGEA